MNSYKIKNREVIIYKTSSLLNILEIVFAWLLVFVFLVILISDMAGILKIFLSSIIVYFLFFICKAILKLKRITLLTNEEILIVEQIGRSRTISLSEIAYVTADNKLEIEMGGGPHKLFQFVWSTYSKIVLKPMMNNLTFVANDNRFLYIPEYMNAHKRKNLSQKLNCPYLNYKKNRE
ncbi:MAG: hypothetical protein WBP35_05235 [Lactococcus chungangensis]